MEMLGNSTLYEVRLHGIAYLGYGYIRVQPIDVEGVNEKFKALTLTTFPGENVAAFALEALKILKIMKTVYAMDVKTGSKLDSSTFPI